jgi:hypothetical protein
MAESHVITPKMTAEELWLFTIALMKADSQVAYKKYVAGYLAWCLAKNS